MTKEEASYHIHACEHLQDPALGLLPVTHVPTLANMSTSSATATAKQLKLYEASMVFRDSDNHEEI
jgi:hypothetical protein